VTFIVVLVLEVSLRPKGPIDFTYALRSYIDRPKVQNDVYIKRYMRFITIRIIIYK
jgi:hypothetical protein